MTIEVRRAMPETNVEAAEERPDIGTLSREASNMRAAAYRYLAEGAQMLRDADAVEQGLMSRQVFRTERCKGCGRQFPLPLGEIAWLEARGFEIRKRCRDCVATKGERRGDRKV